MTTHRAVWIECDACGDTSPGDLAARTVEEARRESPGWIRAYRRDFCNECKVRVPR